MLRYSNSHCEWQGFYTAIYGAIAAAVLQDALKARFAALTLQARLAGSQRGEVDLPETPTALLMRRSSACARAIAAWPHAYPHPAWFRISPAAFANISPNPLSAADAAIELVLILRLVFHFALRQTEGFAASVLRLLGQELRVPDHTTLSRRSRGFAEHQPKVIPNSPMHLLIDSTGLKLFGQGEWDEEKHSRARRSWRKLHLAVDASGGEIVACVLTDNAADDACQVSALLEQTAGEIASVTADGAYDGEPVYQAIAGYQPDPPPDVVIPPRASAVLSTENAAAQSQRNRHIRLTAEKRRMAWQKATGYGWRSLAETAAGRYKGIIGPKLRARVLPAQQGEVAVATKVLNCMIRAAKPVSIRMA